MKATMISATGAILSACVGTALAADPGPASGNWKRLAEGVYEQADADGSVTRIAYGTGGVRYDRAWLTAEVRRLSNKVANGLASEQDVHLLQRRQDALRSLPAKADAPIQVTSTQSGYICDHFAYAFDTNLAAGKGGATAISRAAVSLAQPGPILPVTAMAISEEASITPTGGTELTVTKSANLSSPSVQPAIVDWTPADTSSGYPWVSATSCTAETNASIQLTTTSASCSGSAAYVSLHKSYSQCVTSP
jgi:hypothetical protein